MDDALTESVLGYQAGQVTLEVVRNLVLVTTFEHLRRFQRKAEDEVSEFLLDFYPKVARLLARFEPRGLPFRHYLLRTLRWQWNTFQSKKSRERRRALVALDSGLGQWSLEVAEGPLEEPPVRLLSRVGQRRLVLLALKAAPYLAEDHLEAISRQTGADLSWLQACQHRLTASTLDRMHRRQELIEKRGEAYCRRLMAEDAARRETDPERRLDHERRAVLYRTRLRSLTRQQEAVSTAPTHSELARVLEMPKGSVDSSLYHLKRELASRGQGGDTLSKGSPGGPGAP